MFKRVEARTDEMKITPYALMLAELTSCERCHLAHNSLPSLDIISRLRAKDVAFRRRVQPRPDAVACVQPEWIPGLHRCFETCRQWGLLSSFQCSSNLFLNVSELCFSFSFASSALKAGRLLPRVSSGLSCSLSARTFFIERDEGKRLGPKVWLPLMDRLSGMRLRYLSIDHSVNFCSRSLKTCM